MKRKLPIFYSALLLTGVNLLLRLVSTSFQVYLSGRIGAAGIGLAQLVLSVGALSLTAGIAGVRTATMYLTAAQLGKKHPENVKWVLSGCLLYSVITSGCVSLGLYLLAPTIAAHWIGEPATADAIRLYSAFVPVFCLCGVMTGYFTAANRIGTLAAVEVAEQVLSMGITMSALSFWAGSNPVRACQSMILGSGLGGCVTLSTLVILRCRERVKPGSPIPVRRQLLQTAVPLALADDLKAGISTAENLMVPKRLSQFPSETAPLAAFGMVCGMVFPVLMFPAAILYGLNELLIPELARCNAANSRQRIQYLVKRGLRVALLYGCIFGGLEFLLSDTLCVALYQNEAAGKFLRLYALMIPMLYCDILTDAMTKGLGQQKACVRYNIITSSMDVALLYILLPHYGMHGYYFSFLITHVINFLLSLRRLLKIVGNVICPLTAVAALVSTLFSVLAANVLPSPFLKASAFLLILFPLLWLLRVIGKEDVSWVKGLIKK